MKHLVICPVSVEYKVILDPQKTFKSDGEISKGKRVHFRNGRAEVDDETLEALKQLPEWGFDFLLGADTSMTPAHPIAQPSASGMGMENEREHAKGQLEGLTKQVNLLTEIVTSLAQTVTANQPKGKSKLVEEEEEEFEPPMGTGNEPFEEDEVAPVKSKKKK